MLPGMTPFEEKLSEEVRKYKHLYDTSVRDVQMTTKSWREIAKALRSDEQSVKKQWKNMRSRFVKARRKPRGLDGVKGAPAILKSLSWLETHIRSRDAFKNSGRENNSPVFEDPPSVPCPPADHPPPVLLPHSLPHKSPILVPSTPESRTSDLDSDSSYLLEELETATPGKRQRIESKDVVRRRQTEEHSTVECHFCMAMAKMLCTLPPVVKSETMFKIHQLVYETQKQYLFDGHEDI